MKASRFILTLILSLIFISASAQKNFRLKQTIKPGTYYFNTKDLYFFDDGINCYLLHHCRDIDSVFESNAETIEIKSETEVSYQAYVFTDNYEYIYTNYENKLGWLRVNVDIEESQKEFLKKYLACKLYKAPSQFVEVIPFKTKDKVFLTNAEDWYIINLTTQKAVNIGTKRGGFQACQMYFPKNCVKCYIDLGWGEEIYFNENGKKIKVKQK